MNDLWIELEEDIPRITVGKESGKWQGTYHRRNPQVSWIYWQKDNKILEDEQVFNVVLIY
jgi:hypothetical protein